MNKREDYVSQAAHNAAHRHEEAAGHNTTELYDDDNCMNGMCCYDCDWMRYNVQPRRRKPDMKLSKSRLQLAARLFAANVLLSSQPCFAFESSELTEDETEYLSACVEAIGRRMLGKHESAGKPGDIIQCVKYA